MNDLKQVPAFPCTGDVEFVGMYLRDYFAGQALAGILSAGTKTYFNDAEVAKWAYAIADHMVAARSAGKGGAP